MVERPAPNHEREALRAKFALVLDVPDLALARALAQRLAPFFAVLKVGLELYSSAGPAAVSTLRDDGFAVFVDVKLHDIPTTVGRAARVLGRLGASYVTVHTSGGQAMLEAAVDGLGEGAAEAGVDSAMALGVTVLTSEAGGSDLIACRTRLAAAAGCGGVVCAAGDLALVRGAAPELFTAVPGIRLAGGDPHDQARVATPAEALGAGADLLIVGRAVTAAPDPVRAAADLVAALTQQN